MDEPGSREIRSAVDAERRFVLSLGGYALEIAGATLVTHEKIPAPRFNYVEVGDVSEGRQAAFFERALDHYFQRALRPTFRVAPNAPPHLDRGLRRFGFRPNPSPLELLLETDGKPAPGPRPVDVRPAPPESLGLVASFWSSSAERPELETALRVVVHHPNPGEELRPLVAYLDDQPAAAALVYRNGPAAGVHFVATRPWGRGRGAASSLVTYALHHRPPAPPVRLSILADSERSAAHLETLGFRRAARLIEYSLPPEAQLSLPPPGPPVPPRWRPPR